MIERNRRARVDHFGADSQFLKLSGGGQGYVNHAAGCNQRNILAIAFYVGHPEGNGIFLIGDGTL
jgi:hypothetical protein